MAAESVDPVKKWRYIRSIASDIGTLLPEYRIFGLTGEFKNICRHSFVEIPRCTVFAELLNFSGEIKDTLETAAALHDVDKIEQIKYFKSGTVTFESFLDEHKKSHAKMSDLFGEPISTLIHSVGSDSLHEVMPLLEREQLSDFDLARLTLFYVDAYTIGDSWAESKEKMPDLGQINDVDRRFDRAEQNPGYASLNESSRRYFDGETHFVVVRRVSHQIENVLADQIAKRSGLSVDPLDLPEFIDNKIKEKINSF